jgi:hypothetical protein
MLADSPRPTPRDCGFVAGARCATVTLALCVAPAALNAQAADHRLPAWLAGCWVMRAGPLVIDEQWMAPAGGTMLGMNRTIVRDTTRQHEFLRIAVTDSGVVYHAAPSTQAPAAFVASEITGYRAIFDNPAHDFPQRIGYRSAGDSLYAWIEGEDDDGPARGEFRYARRSCGAAEPSGGK